MSEPQFALASTPGLYWLAEPALPAGYGIALVLAADAPPAPATLTLAASWTAHPGLYAMCAARPDAAAESEFLHALRNAWSWLGASARFLWLAQTDLAQTNLANTAGWAPQTLHVAQPAGSPTATLAAPANLRFGRYSVNLARGLTLTQREDGFALSGGPPAPLSLSTPEAQWLLGAPGGQQPATALSFAGATAGCLALSLALPQHAGADYELLDVGLRIAARAERPDLRAAGLLVSLRYPLLAAPPAGGVTFACSFDPALALAPTRTRLAFAGEAQHDSGYRAQLGAAVSLTPQVAAGVALNLRPEIGALPAGLAFHRRPPSLHAVAQDDPLYLAPIGGFALEVGGSPAKLACGTSGYEYFSCATADAAGVTFTPSQPAYAQGLTPTAAEHDRDDDVMLSPLATCPYATVVARAQAGVTYFAQPRQGALHRVRAGGDPALTPYLEYLAIPATQASTGTCYPLLPYAGASGAQALRERLEAQVLAPLRRRRIAALTQARRAPVSEPGQEAPPGPARAQHAPPPGDGAIAAVTPRGLLAGFDASLSTWTSLQLSADPSGNEPPPLQLRDLGDELHAALLSSELFLVIADATWLSGNAELNYWVTDAALADLRALPPAQRPSEAVLSALAQTPARAPQQSQTAFEALLNRVLPSTWTQWRAAILRLCAYFELTIERWRFRLAPALWATVSDPSRPLLMILKLASASVRELALDPSSWTWPRAAWIDGGPQRAARALAAIIADADAALEHVAGGHPSPLANFVEQVLDDRSWNGLLFLDVPVALADLPAELRGLAGGIDPARLRAHHVGVSLSPVELDTATRSLSLKPTPLFGLIDYRDPADIDHSFADFDFKVLALGVLFADSAIVEFSARAELFVNRLLGDRVLLEGGAHYNNLVLDGSLQHTPAGAHYVFATADAALLRSSGQVLDSIEVTLAQFSTAAADDMVSARFSLWGRLRFRLLDAIDLFSFGPVQPSPAEPVTDGWLSFSGLAVTMRFDPEDPAGTRTFASDVGEVACDSASSVAREHSWFRRFPLAVTGLIRGEPGSALRDAGYLPVRTPLYQPALDAGWHALTFALDLGTLGALAADAGLTASVALAWGPGEDAAAVNVGMRLAGLQALGQPLPLQGVIELGFQAIELRTSPAPGGGPSYVIDLRRFALALLGWRLPPGQADLHLFGDPDLARQPAGARRGALGWYAAYEQG